MRVIAGVRSAACDESGKRSSNAVEARRPAGIAGQFYGEEGGRSGRAKSTTRATSLVDNLPAPSARARCMSLGTDCNVRSGELIALEHTCLSRRVERAVDERLGVALELQLELDVVESTNTKIRLLTRIAFGFKNPDALIALAMLALSAVTAQPCRPLVTHGSVRRAQNRWGSGLLRGTMDDAEGPGPEEVSPVDVRTVGNWVCDFFSRPRSSI